MTANQWMPPMPADRRILVIGPEAEQAAQTLASHGIAARAATAEEARAVTTAPERDGPSIDPASSMLTNQYVTSSGGTNWVQFGIDVVRAGGPGNRAQRRAAERAERKAAKRRRREPPILWR